MASDSVHTGCAKASTMYHHLDLLAKECMRVWQINGPTNVSRACNWRLDMRLIDSNHDRVTTIVSVLIPAF